MKSQPGPPLPSRCSLGAAVDGAGLPWEEALLQRLQQLTQGLSGMLPQP